MIQQTIFENQIEYYLEQNLDKYMKMYFEKHYMSIDSLKKGKDRCLLCGKPLKSYIKTMDKRLIELLLKIDRLVSEKKREKFFAPREVFTNNHWEIADFQKLSFWGLISRGKSHWWELTYRGKQFAHGNIQIPWRVEIFNWSYLRKPIWEDDTMIKINTADERWQTCAEDHIMDHIIVELIKPAYNEGKNYLDRVYST